MAGKVDEAMLETLLAGCKRPQDVATLYTQMLDSRCVRRAFLVPQIFSQHHDYHGATSIFPAGSYGASPPARLASRGSVAAPPNAFRQLAGMLVTA